MQEIWKDIKGYEKLYQASNLGNIRSLDKYVHSKNNSLRFVQGRLIKTKVCRSGYLNVCLWKNGSKKCFYVHRLIANTFLNNPNNLPQINHIDMDKTNNKVFNLEFCTAKYNIQQTFKKGRTKINSGCFKKGNIPQNIRKVIQRDLSGKFIKEWNSIKEAQSTLLIYHISSCCSGKRKTAGGFLWEYVK